MGMKKYVQPDCQAAEDGKTVASAQDETDLGKLLAKAQRTGTLSHIQKFEREYGVKDPFTYEDAMNAIARQNSMFAELPSEVRNEFGNSPAAFSSFVQAHSADEIKEKLPILAKPGRQFPDVIGGGPAAAEAAPPPSTPASPASEPSAQPPQAE